MSPLCGKAAILLPHQLCHSHFLALPPSEFFSANLLKDLAKNDQLPNSQEFQLASKYEAQYIFTITNITSTSLQELSEVSHFTV